MNKTTYERSEKSESPLHNRYDINEINDVNLSEQLKDVLVKEHLRYLKGEGVTTDLIDSKTNEFDDDNSWPNETICLIGDSIRSGLGGRRMQRNGKIVKVRCFPGAYIADMRDYCKPIIKRPLGEMTYNAEMSEDAMNEFCCVYSLSSLVSKPTCFKIPNKPSCIDLILTNKPLSFKNTTLIETGLSDVHKLTLTVMKCSFQKQFPKVIYYRNYKYFDNDAFQR